MQPVSGQGVNMATTMILAMRHTENDAESELCMSMHHLYLSNTTSTTVQMLFYGISVIHTRTL